MGYSVVSMMSLAAFSSVICTCPQKPKILTEISVLKPEISAEASTIVAIEIATATTAIPRIVRLMDWEPPLATPRARKSGRFMVQR